MTSREICEKLIAYDNALEHVPVGTEHMLEIANDIIHLLAEAEKGQVGHA